MEEENYEVINSFENSNWWYRSKRELFTLLLSKIGRTFEEALDVGCGVGSNSEVLAKFSKKVVGIDNSEKALQYCQSKKYDSLHQMSATNLEFKKDRFDLVLCSDVLEHIPDREAMDQIARVLKPGGLLLLSVPAHNYLWGPTDVISKHRKRYEKVDVKNILSKRFRIKRLFYWNFLMFVPNLIFIKSLAFQKKMKPTNTLQLIPSFLNKMIYMLLSIENRFILRYKVPNGVSIVAVAKKRR